MANMIARTLLASFTKIVLLLMLAMTTSVASGQTALPGGFEIRLQPEFTHEPLQGIDSIVGKIVKKDGLQIQYEMGPIPAAGAPRLGGHFVNQALQLPANDRVWLKEQNVGGRKLHVAYSKENVLLISSTSATEGINFHTVAKTPEEVADVLLMVVSLAVSKPK